MSAEPPRALVLGGRGDIGGAVAARLREAGYAVDACGRTDFDLADPAAIDAWFAGAPRDYDVLVHSAGYNQPAPFLEQDVAAIERTLDANLTGFLRVAKHVAPGMVARQSGRIVVVSSLYGFLGRRGRIGYAMAKHALNGAVKTLAIEFGPAGVLVNAVSPGFVMTRMTRANNDAATIERLTAGIPVGRMAEPAEIAEAVLFLCLPSNRYITGQDLVVDGGYSAGGFQG